MSSIGIPNDIFNLNGTTFIRGLLDWEQRRFDNAQFLSSEFKELGTEFGTAFEPAYPCYFSGNINEPEGKYIVVGINPGYSDDTLAEQKFYKDRGLFEASCYVFRDYYGRRQQPVFRHYSRIAGFLRKLYGIPGTMDWIWLHNNLISLEVVPYHSRDAKQLKINNPKKFREFHLEALLRIIRHLAPTNPIIISGLAHVDFFLRRECEDVFKLVKHERKALKGAKRKYSFYTGTMDGKYPVLVVPFLTQPPVPIDELVAQIRSV